MSRGVVAFVVVTSICVTNPAQVPRVPPHVEVIAGEVRIARAIDSRLHAAAFFENDEVLMLIFNVVIVAAANTLELKAIVPAIVADRGAIVRIESRAKAGFLIDMAQRFPAI